MIKNVLMTCIVVLFSNVLFAQTEEEILIRKTIESESEAYHENNDRKAYLHFWSITDASFMYYSGLDNARVFLNGEMMMKISQSDDTSKPDLAKRTFSNMRIRNNVTLAWVSFDQTSTTPDGKTNYMHEARCMEKINGQWKIIGSTVHQYLP